MKINCPSLKCKKSLSNSPNDGSIVRNGSYFRTSDSRRIRRYHCGSCNLHFSAATIDPRIRQKKRRINPLLRKLICSEVSQRRAAIIIGVNRKTIVRHFRFLARQSELEHISWMKSQYAKNPILSLQFDDLETSEHTKCKPVSVALAVEANHRKILNFKVSQMPARGLLTKKAFEKYGFRKDRRSMGWNLMMKELKPHVHTEAVFTSDENPHYPKYLKRHHPKATHVQIKGGRGAITGQGELKKLKYDPIFSLNHTCAMLRANINRLIRKTWCTTKTIKGLTDHLWIYVVYHNQILTQNQHASGPVSIDS